MRWATRTRGPPAGMTGPAAGSTGHPATRWPPTSQMEMSRPVASTVTSSVPPPGGRAAFPERLDVDVTAKHLTEGSRTRPGDSPLALALHDALGAAGIPFTRIEATDASFRIYH